MKAILSTAFLLCACVFSANAQTFSVNIDTVKVKPKIFGGSGQYRTWSVGFNAGITSPFLAIGGSNNFKSPDLSLGYSITVRKQLAHSFGVQLDVMGPGSKIAGHDMENGSAAAPGSFATTINYTATISGVVKVATVDFLARKNAVNFYVSAGAGLIGYTPKAYNTTDASGIIVRQSTDGDGLTQIAIPIGVGLKFRMSDRVAFNLGYSGTFTDGDYLDATKVTTGAHKDKFSFAYGGLEFTLGSTKKQNLTWVNPVAIMMDELKDPTLRLEVEALKKRVANLEVSISDMKKDSDGDGVSDMMDKCPGTPAGTVVDGSGCPIKFPKVEPDGAVMIGGSAPASAPYRKIQFEFSSSALRTSSYPVLDATSADMKANRTLLVELDGHTSSEPDGEGNGPKGKALALDRARSVKTYLINSGVYGWALQTNGFGATHPVADNSTEDGRELNRRVEFTKLNYQKYAAVRFNANTIVINNTPTLAAKADEIKAHPTWKVILIGHSTAAEINNPHNKQQALYDLAKNRVQAVVSYLVNHGVNAGRIVVRSNGAAQPLSGADTTADQHLENQSVELVLFTK